METFDLVALKGQQDGGKPYLEFLRAPSMSMGLYVLPAGSTDGQSPHSEDEVYVVTAGRSKFVCDDATVDVQPGSILFVPALANHRFFEIAEDLSILVFFAPAEYLNKTGA
ncbi:MAG: cupin domain-containing protein [Armatimonadetes bacterium]|nr:cupin domain-containing protein [Armatimonadota bacterium]